MTLTFEEYLQLHTMRGETEVSFELDMKPFCEYLDCFYRDITHKKFIDWYEVDEMNRIVTRCASLHIRCFRKLKEENKQLLEENEYLRNKLNKILSVINE